MQGAWEMGGGQLKGSKLVYVSVCVAPAVAVVVAVVDTASWCHGLPYCSSSGRCSGL